MALPAIPIALLLKYLMGGSSVALLLSELSNAAGGPSIGSVLGADPEAANAEHEKAQQAELTKFRQREQQEAYVDTVAGSMMPDPNEMATLGTVLQSGLFDSELGTPQQNLLNFAARKMGTTPKDLEVRTRNRSPFQQIRGY